MSEIFAGRNFREFREEGRIRENSSAKITVGMYKMAAVTTGNVGTKGDCLCIRL